MNKSISVAPRSCFPSRLLIRQVERAAAGISRLKLGDFGLAMVVTEPAFTICGTPTYVAPEILNETGWCCLHSRRLQLSQMLAVAQ